MKKSIAILLCAILLVSLFSACSAKPAEVEQPEAATTPAAESQPQQEQAEEPRRSKHRENGDYLLEWFHRY